jgi:hypothetical protein
LDNAERSKQLAPRHFNSIGAVCNSQTSGIAAFLSRIGRRNEYAGNRLGDSAFLLDYRASN